MQKLISFAVVALVMLVVVTCKKSSIEPAPIDKSYYPLQTGKYIIYDVDSITMSNFFDTTDTAHYQVMEEVDVPYTEASGDTAYRIIRSRREDPGQAWTITDIWSANLTEHTAEKVEENLRFIKLDFPVLLNKSWNGNSYIETDSPVAYLSDWEYRYTEVDVPLAIGVLSFDSVVTVTQYDDENAIQKMLYVERYAKHVGMVYKEEQNYETQPGQYPDGYILRMSIAEYN